MKKLVLLFLASSLAYCAPVAAWTIVGPVPSSAYTLQEGTYLQALSKGGSTRYYKIDEATKCDEQPKPLAAVSSTYEVQFGTLYKYYTTKSGGQKYPPASFADECVKPEPEPEQQCVSYEFVGQQKIWVNPIDKLNLNDCQFLLVNIKDYKGNGKYDVDVTMYDGAKLDPKTGTRSCTPPL